MIETPDHQTFYAIDPGSGALTQIVVTPTGIALVRVYHDGPDGIGFNGATRMTWSPDARVLYIAGQQRNSSQAGTVAAFTRDPVTDQLTFTSLFRGPDLEGGPVDAPAPSPAVSINSGEIYTNTPQVTLSLAGGFSYEVSNSGGFAQAARVSPNRSGRYAWRLASTGPERLPQPCTSASTRHSTSR